jgi:hypothetical protein
MSLHNASRWRKRSQGTACFYSPPIDLISTDTANLLFDDFMLMHPRLRYAMAQMEAHRPPGLCATLLPRPEIIASSLAAERIGLKPDAPHLAFRTPASARPLLNAYNILYLPWGEAIPPAPAGARLPTAESLAAIGRFDEVWCDSDVAAKALGTQNVPTKVARFAAAGLLSGAEVGDAEHAANLPAARIAGWGNIAAKSILAQDLPTLRELLDTRPETSSVTVMHIAAFDWEPNVAAAILGFLTDARLARANGVLILMVDACGLSTVGEVIHTCRARRLLPEGLVTEQILLTFYPGDRQSRLNVGAIADFALSPSGAGAADGAFLDLVAGGAFPIALEGSASAEYVGKTVISVANESGRYLGNDLLCLFPPHLIPCLAQRRIANAAAFRAAFEDARGLSAAARDWRGAAIARHAESLVHDSASLDTARVPSKAAVK